VGFVILRSFLVLNLLLDYESMRRCGFSCTSNRPTGVAKRATDVVMDLFLCSTFLLLRCIISTVEGSALAAAAATCGVW